MGLSVLVAADVEGLLNYGATGVFALLLVTGLLVAKPIYAQQTDRGDRAEARLDALTKDVMERVAPVLDRAITTINARTEVETDVVDVLKDVRRLLEQR